MKLSNNSKTLFIPLIGKANMSKEGIFIDDAKAEEIVSKINISDIKISKWLSLYMSLRAVIFDNICSNFIINNENAIIIHIGCGLDSRNIRVKEEYYKWYDIDLKEVIEFRKKFFQETEKYKMIGASITEKSWLNEISETDKPILIIAEGLSMFLTNEEISEFVKNIKKKFKKVRFVFDAYSKFFCKVSKYKNPVNQVDAKIVWGIDKPEEFKNIATGITFNDSYLIYNEELIDSLEGITKYVFKYVFAGKISEKNYKIYSFDILNRNM